MIAFANEQPGDAAAREALLDRAMGRARVLKPSERLRRGRVPAPGLALVARRGGRLVGSVRLWKVAAGGRPALLLGPLAVDPAAQSEGVGCHLMNLMIARARELGHESIILVGDPEYYARFGFSADLTCGLVMPAPVERRRFLALELVPLALVDASGMVVATGEKLAAPMLIAA